MVKKRVYRAVNVKTVSIEELRDELGGQRCVCGIDVAKTNFFATLMNERREVVVTIKWEHPTQTTEFLELLEGVDAERIEAVMESSGSYGDALHHILEARGIDVFRVSSKRSHDAAELYDGVPSSHDAKSAMILARLHLEGVSERWHLPTAQVRTLAAASKVHERYAEYQMRLLGQLEAELARYWPELPRQIDLTSLSLASLVAEFGSPQAVAAAPEQARTLLSKASRGALRPERIAAIIASSERTVGVEAVPAEAQGLRDLASELLRMRAQLARTQRELEDRVQSHEAFAPVAAAIGKATAARLIGDAGDPRQFSSARAYEKSLGLNVKERSSGKKRGKVGLTKRGSGTARRLLFLAVMRFVQDDAVVKAYHKAKSKRDGGIKMKSMVAIMRKLARAIWHIAMTGDAFDAERLFDTRRLAGLARA